MRKSGIINGEIMGVLAGLCHGDRVVISDAGLPIPEGVKCVDLALINGIPGFLDTLKAVVNEAIFEKIVIFELMKDHNPEKYKIVTEMFEKQEKVLYGPEELMEEAKQAKLIIRTAEFTPCCNVVLYSASGVAEMCAPFDITV